MLLVACGPVKGRIDDHNSVLTASQSIDFMSMNPMFDAGALQDELTHLAFSTLLETDARGNLVPSVARVVPSLANHGISRNGLDITYRLRKDVRWADGAPLTADDVVFTHRVQMDPRNNVPDHYGDQEVADIDAPDRYTVHVHLQRPFAPFLAEFTRAILPRHILMKYRDLNAVPFNDVPVGSGPYRFVSWQHGAAVTFETNPLYWGRKPRIRRLRLLIIPTPQTAVQQLRTGEVDLAPALESNSITQLGVQPQLRVVLWPTRQFRTLVFNMGSPALQDIGVRRALAEGLNLASLLDKITHNVEDARNGGVGLFDWANDPSITAPAYNLVDANALLDQAGWKRRANGGRWRNGKRLSLTLVTGNDTAVQTGMAVQLEAAAQTLGVDLQIHTYDESRLFLETKDGIFYGRHFDLAFTAFSTATDPDVEWLLGCPGGHPEPYNTAGYCDRKMDADLTRADSTFDPDERKAAFALVQRRLAHDLPLVLLSTVRNVAVVNRRLTGFAPSADGGAYWNITSWNLR